MHAGIASDHMHIPHPLATCTRAVQHPIGGFTAQSFGANLYRTDYKGSKGYNVSEPEAEMNLGIGLDPPPDIERRMYDCFPALPGGVNDFAEALDANTACGELARSCLNDEFALCFITRLGTDAYTLHQRQGRYSVMALLREGLASNGTKGARGFVVRTESYDEDLNSLWRWLCLTDPLPTSTHWDGGDFPRHSDTHISADGLRNLHAVSRLEQWAHDALEQLADNGALRARDTPRRRLKAFSKQEKRLLSTGDDAALLP